MSDLIVRPYALEDRGLWDDFVRTSKNGTFLIQRGFMDYHADRFVDASSIVSDTGGKAVALFPASRSEGTLVSHAGLSYGGMIANDTMSASRAIDVLGAWLGHWSQHGIEKVVYKAIPPIYHQMPADEDRYALFYHGAMLYRRDVTSVVDFQTDAPVQQRRRRGRNKAQRASLTFRETDDVAEFWEMLRRNLNERHQANPVHSAEEIRLLKSRFPENIRLFGVYGNDGLAAGTLLFCCSSTIHAQYIASTDSGRQQGALDLLFFELMDTFRSSARYFDFGNSNEEDGRYLNRGLIEFKEGFGARSIVQDFYSLDLALWQARTLSK